MTLSKIILCILAALTVTTSNAQSIALNFLHYNTSNQLGSNYVRKTTQDSRGYIWCATQDGLYRFDGLNFIAYNKSLPNNHRVTGSDVRDLLIVNDTLYAVSSYGGLDAIDINTGNVAYSYNQQGNPALRKTLFHSIAYAGNRLYLGSDKGLYLFDVHKKTVTLVPIQTPAAFFNTTNIDKLLAEGRNLWLFCKKGDIYILNTTTGQLAATVPTDIDRFYDADIVNSIITTGTSKGIRHYQFEGNKINSVQVPFQEKYTSASPVFSVKRDHNGCLWFSDKNNLIKVDEAGRQMQIVYSAKLINGKDLTASVYGIFFDNRNNVWLSSQEGLLFSNNQPTAFLAFNKSRNSATAITRSYFLYPDNDTTVYVCAEDGLYQVNTRTFSIVPLDQGRTYFYAFRDHRNQLIVSCDEGTYIWRNTERVPFEQDYPEFNRLAELIMLNSYVKMNDTLFALGSQNRKGIYLWNPGKGSIRKINSESAGTHLPDDNINTLVKDNSEKLWVLCDNSISIYNIRTHTLTDLNLENPVTKYRYSIFFDICKLNDSYFIASYTNGIIKLDSSYRFIKEITVQNNLSNNGVYKLLPYKDSLLLASTNIGLSVLNLFTGQIKNYYEKNGLQSNDFEELSGNTRNELIYAGGRDGFTIINPKRFTRNTVAPALFFRNISIEIDPQNRIDTSNLNIQQVRIPSNAKQTSIYFSGINYANPDRTSFTYRIVELQKDWISLNNQNFITLIGLAPGTYHLQVQAFNEDGIPSAVKELTLLFLPKWYQTGWFKLLLGALAIGIIYLIYRVRINQLKKEQQIRTRLASDLHDDLGSTMNSVKIYASLAIMEKQTDKYLLKVKESTQEAITGIRDMIWILDDKKDTIEHLLTRFNAFVKPVCEAKGITYQQQVSDDALSYRLGQEERRNLFMVLKESVNNAIKYSECNKIELTVSLRKLKPELTICDNGNGFDTGTHTEGNGIKNMRRRAMEIKYHYQMASSPATGTSIHLWKI